ncbi:YgaP family membrane protein [Lyngbya confervoides]|uniref:DUF2892 domain-containing protein n=1 Tax=Lyngbya confervoides BDU141951 TaxID=1574623 RepID=A0ABD4T5L8_9CYAN|nr:DUF2892 domain-containing protein [Lyngbya confervoides]MCM1983783.1 DUF2892 domain-containing protein [Lyngbya confervoides BDU141951]
MISNVGMMDRVIRLLFAAGLFYLGVGIFADSALGVGLDIAAAIALLTSLLGFCGLYQWLGISTRHTTPSP